MRLILLVLAFIAILQTKSGHADTCYASSVINPSPFMGNDGEIFQLADGSLWIVKYEYEYLYEYFPRIIICPSDGALIINGTKLNVQQLAGGGAPPAPEDAPQTEAIIETRIDGEFTGWDGETIFKLMNGQIWQQVSYAYIYYYKYSPNVLIVLVGANYVLHVEGIDQQIQVRRLR